MFHHDGDVGPAELDVNLRAASLNAGVVPAICSGNDPEAVGMDRIRRAIAHDAKFLKIVIRSSCVPIRELWLLGSACDLGIY